MSSLSQVDRSGGGGRARKSPLRLATDPVPVVSAGSSRAPNDFADAGFQRGDLSPLQLRQVMISEYGEWLRTQANRHGRPFQAETISAYRDAAVALSAWMTSSGLEADFIGCDTAALNRFFRAYLASHSQGGTNTKQRNLRHLFTWLAAEYGHPHPYTDALVRYTPVKVRPTLAADFIKDLLSATGSGRARTFEDARDHAMIRVLTEGVRRAELVQIRLDDLPADLIARPYIRVVPLKGARAADEGRIVPLTLATAKAIVAYLRARQSHGQAQTSPALWLGTRNRGPVTGNGVWRMVKRRAEQAGYEPSVYPHMFRHTFAHDWLAGGGAEGDLMRLMGWQDRAMLDRYGADLQVQRAIEAKRRRGEMY
jgi:site-specific recombinase XerD